MGLLILSIVTIYHLKKPKRVSKSTLLYFGTPHWSRYQSEEFSPIDDLISEIDGYVDIQTYMCIWIFGYMDIWIYGYMDISSYIYGDMDMDMDMGAEAVVGVSDALSVLHVPR